MKIRSIILNEANTWLGTPYHHQGAVKGVGVDCAQLLIEVYHRTGIMVPKVAPGNYPQDWHMHRSDEKYLGWVMQYARQVSEPLPGDIALYKFGRCISHGAIVTNYPNVIHSYFRQGCIISREDGIELKGRIHSYWSMLDNFGGILKK